MYIIGSGPNIATALQAALILSESTKLNFTGIPIAQYDPGFELTLGKLYDGELFEVSIE